MCVCVCESLSACGSEAPQIYGHCLQVNCIGFKTKHYRAASALTKCLSAASVSVCVSVLSVYILVCVCVPVCVFPGKNNTRNPLSKQQARSC